MKIPTVAKTWADHELVSPLLLNYINQKVEMTLFVVNYNLGFRFMSR